MQKFLYITLFVSLSLLLYSFGNPNKQVKKIISKVWKNMDVMVTDISIPDSLKSDIRILQQISFEEEIVGFACYTTAFGCRVGGCAAPSNANVQSYETFDYVVIYDQNFRIKKVDIANYGGEYGYEICRPKWLAQFQGGSSGFKLGENIDGITGATVSANYLIEDLNGLSEILQSFEAIAAK